MSAAPKRGGRGRFIVLEGLDWAGTTTQTERLAAALRAEGHAVLTSREPSDGPIGTLIRQALTGRLVIPGTHAPLAPETLALLFAADRTDHLQARVLPALARGEIVLCDRYLLSSLAYQGKDLPMDWVEVVNGCAISPDLTLFVEVAPAVAARRRAGRGGPAELFEADEAQRRIAKAYLAAIRRREGRERIVRIDGGQPPEAVTAAALAQVRKVLARRVSSPRVG